MTNKKVFIAYIQSIYKVSREKAMEISYGFKPVIFQSGEYLIEEQRLDRHAYFLEEGYVRSFMNDSKGLELTTGIYSPKCFLNDFNTFFSQQPSAETFQTLTECSGWVISWEEIESRYHSSVEFREFCRLLILDGYNRMKQRLIGLLSDTEEARYRKLLSEQPEIFRYAQSSQIASYLGITISVLNRLREEMILS